MKTLSCGLWKVGVALNKLKFENALNCNKLFFHPVVTRLDLKAPIPICAAEKIEFFRRSLLGQVRLFFSSTSITETSLSLKLQKSANRTKPTVTRLLLGMLTQSIFVCWFSSSSQPFLLYGSFSASNTSVKPLNTVKTLAGRLYLYLLSPTTSIDPNPQNDVLLV